MRPRQKICHKREESKNAVRAAPRLPGPVAARPGRAPLTPHTIAFTPVAARPMISFWICDVPSYRVVTRASLKYRSTG